MSKFIVYQIPSYTNKEINLIKSKGWDNAANSSLRIRAFQAVSGFKPVFKSEYTEFYEVVAECEASSLFDVFDAGNLMTENYKTLVDSNRSLSVGDVVFDVKQNTYYLCESFGWRDITELFVEVCR